MNPNTITLPAWLTPAFARSWLKRDANAANGQRRLSPDQRFRYAAIADGQDWNARRQYRLAWAAPYTGHYLADQVAAHKQPVAEDAHENGHDARLAFWQRAKTAIRAGEIDPEIVNALAKQGEGDGWERALQALNQELNQ